MVNYFNLIVVKVMYINFMYKCYTIAISVTSLQDLYDYFLFW